MGQHIRRQYTFEGRVQGVGFRATSLALTRRFPVTGWVRNESDKSVTLQVQGEEADVSSYVAQLERVMERNITRSSFIPVAEVIGESAFVIQR